jgi:hypothetical protein
LTTPLDVVKVCKGGGREREKGGEGGGAVSEEGGVVKERGGERALVCLICF